MTIENIITVTWDGPIAFWGLFCARNAPSTTIPFVFESQPREHKFPMTDCRRCQWAVRRGALVAHVMMRDPSWHK
jgi:hypothetical protein